MLWKQAVRSMWRNKKSYLACLLLMSLGVAMYVALNLLFVNLAAAQNGMYEEQRFGDAFAVVSGIPLNALDRLNAIPGIAAVDGVTTTDSRVMKPDSNRVIILRLNAWQPENQNRLNNFVLVEGALPGEDGILVSQVFAQANNLRIGDSVPLIVSGQRDDPVVTGFVQSPEYVYAIPDTGQLMADNEAFGFGYMEEARLGLLNGKSGMATNLSFLLEEGATFQQIRYPLEEALESYGLVSLIGRKDQASHAMLQQEIDSIGSMASSLPMAFLFLSVIILYILLKRIIEQERTQIGTMKAFGLSDSAVLLHYICYGGITGLVGGLAGVVLGILMTGSMTELYLEFFSLPAMRVPPDPSYLVGGFVMAVAAGVLGSFMGARGILKLNPSEAMRPPAPPGVTDDWLGKIPFLRKILSTYGYMAIRNVSRNKFRSSFVVIGVSFSFALTAFIASFGEMFDLMLLDQFSKVQLYNIRIDLKEPSSPTAALETVRSLEGIRQAETLLELPAELRNSHRKQSTSVVALEPDSRLYQIYDNESGLAVPPPSGGVILSNALADHLGAVRGSVLQLKTPYTGDEEYSLPVVGIVHSNLGATAYMGMDSLWELLHTAPAVTSLILDASDTDSIKATLLEADGVASITDQQEASKLYVDLLDTYIVLIYMMQLIGAVIAFAIIATTASISLSERKREYATMRVMGLETREIGQVVGFEYWFLSLLAIPPGILLTRVLKQAMATSINNDIFSIPLYTAPSSFLSAAVLCLAAVVFSNWSSRRKIAGFDMVEVLKERE